MKLLVFRALWGMTGTIEQQIQQIADAGYDGIDMWVDFAPPPSQLLPLLEARGLTLIASGPAPRREDLEPLFARLAEYHPVKMSLHAGRDSMTRDEGTRFFEDALRLQAQVDVPVSYETHRGRLLYCPWDTLFYLQAFDNLNLTVDYSHWVNVCERLPDDQAEALDLANRRARHIHGRVGYEEGPQVPDPTAAEFQYAVAWHERQWRRIWEHRRDANESEFTFTPEYGPPSYLHTLPHTNVPVADLWNICLWAANRARELFV